MKITFFKIMNFIGLILRNGNLTKQVSHAILRNTKETGAESPQAKTIFHKLEIFYWCHLVDKRLLLSTCLLQHRNIWSELGNKHPTHVYVLRIYECHTRPFSKRNQLQFPLVPYAMKYQSYSKTVSIILNVEKQCVFEI